MNSFETGDAVLYRVIDFGAIFETQFESFKYRRNCLILLIKSILRQSLSKGHQHLLKTEAWKIVYFYLFSAVFCIVILDENGRIKNCVTFVYTIV